MLTKHVEIFLYALELVGDVAHHHGCPRLLAAHDFALDHAVDGVVCLDPLVLLDRGEAREEVRAVVLPLAGKVVEVLHPPGVVDVLPARLLGERQEKRGRGKANKANRAKKKNIMKELCGHTGGGMGMTW